MQSSLVLSVLLICSGVIAVPISGLTDFTEIESFQKQGSNVPTHLLNPTSPQPHSLQAQHPPQSGKPSFPVQPAPQHLSDVAQSDVVHAPVPISSSPAPGGTNPQSGSVVNGGGMPAGFASNVARLVGGSTAFGTGTTSNVISGGHKGEPLVNGAGAIADATVGVAGQAAGMPKPNA
ncbi:hypothetical protein PGT21_024788 [Puccinia graminis f. sp. tritici]|uniref:Uncharacterized protein n=2 Tax=Puccinia graminis f. sp. tritici TaxID=56615 RepID=E3KDG7_PUCGT|nr:uncharacterized protein PGTG_08359 [Puccinia graminis f. sp. tritici CRL 75-36-700-3]EFP82403.1 hypothetical protein PGTG_08359 [Puccinia graminis f. sp. tritici CRL 75-36-700-3]KAA1079802.1 hypothetical protein PGT21_024788 [Puccinia graminis f. sp. tritici]KAA1100743.1 hypothetical protein PGTUg99_021850 [Puccinia graminis f. sp. tritici]